MVFSKEEWEIIEKMVEWNLFMVDEKIKQYGDEDGRLKEHFNMVLEIYRKLKAYPFE